MRNLFKWYGDALLNPKTRWWVLLGSLVYLLSPIDLAPDFIPLLGQIDDGVLLMLLVSGVSQLLASQFSLDQQPDLNDNAPPSTPANSKDPGTKTINVDAVEVK